jgi:DamX protein
VIARRRLLALILALAAFGIALAVGAASGGSSETPAHEGSKKISVASGEVEAVRLEASGALPALREKPAEPSAPATSSSEPAAPSVPPAQPAPQPQPQPAPQPQPEPEPPVVID